MTEEDEKMKLINDVQEYFYGNETLAKTFEDFVKTRCDVIDLSNEEYKLVYTEIFNEYKLLFESKMEHYIEVNRIIALTKPFPTSTIF